MSDVSIVIAARNEADNIVEVVSRCRQFGRVIVVDDASSDETGELACQAGAIVLRHSSNTHIKQAFVDGFRRALALNSEYIIQMDAGLSHNPDEIPRLLAPLERGVDMAIGSRFVKGGVLIDQPLYRQLLSRFGSALVRLVTSMDIADLTSGFKGYKGSLLSHLDSEEVLDSLRSRAFAFQFELTNEIHGRGFVIEEVPITYKASGSSLSRKVVLESFHVWLGLLRKMRIGKRGPLSAWRE